MCVRPSTVWVESAGTHIKHQVPCGDCWRCRANRVNDFVGRALCEASVSDWTKVITLTYAPRLDGADVVIHPRHFQNFIKRVRRGGTNIRYLACGEYGDLKGRVHFHAVLFGRGKPPVVSKENPVPWPGDKSMFHIPEWPHGHVIVDGRATERALRYACKYMMKGEPGSYWFSVSKKPALGHEYFQRLAREHVRLEAMPHGFEYRPPGSTRRNKYVLTGAVRRDYLATIFEELRQDKSVDRFRTPAQAAELDRMSEWVRNAVKLLYRAEYKAFAESQGEMEELIARIEKNRLDEWQVRRQILYEDLDQAQGDDDGEAA